LEEMRATISRELVRPHAEYYGKGPTKAQTTSTTTSWSSCCKSFTRAEKTLTGRGEGADRTDMTGFEEA
jgi:hypothetical protein